MTPTDLIRELIEKELAADRVVPAEAASRILNQLKGEAPEALQAYLEEQGQRLIREDILSLLHSRRATARSSARPRIFARAATQGDADQLGIFAMPFEVGPDRVQSRLGEMRAPELAYAAERYEERAATNAMQAAFLRAVQRKVGRKTVAEAMDEATCQRLYDSITAAGRAA